MKLGHTDGGRKLYFVGYTELDDDGHLFYPLEIKVYDIPKRKWMDSIPKLKAPTCYPLVFFIDHWLYVISFDIPEGGQPQPHFEMLNISYLSKGWVSLPLPNTLFFKDQTWYTYTIGKPLTPLTGHLLSLSWWDHLVIVENHLYSFQRNKSQFLLIIRDLESIPDNKVDEGTIICEFDVTNTVHQDVLNDKRALYSLRYLGKKGSCRRFFVAILYSPRNYHSLVSTCTLDLSDEFKVQKSSCQNKPLNPGPYLMHPLQCEVLCESNTTQFIKDGDTIVSSDGTLVPLTDKSGVLKVIQPGIVCVWVMLIWTYAMEEAGACYGSGSWLTSDNYLHQDTISMLGCPLQISVLVFSGETGCGKTTQLPQSILQEEISFLHGADCNIICTQPRRISAISVAARICSEKGEDLGDTVGYQIPVQSKRYHT
ncbi:hypothetical protein T459_17169 [Capsicum annuum]|uniref:RNA helicase n=1 Tax=Capsicum annuum TaxID=4072 RepID=A0A2G2ZAT1_CAPAN|nr:hypothetical protein T459_17169 [Capsicum annuum]